MKKFVFVIAAALFALTANATQLVTNGDFQTGNISGWTLTGNTGNSAVLTGAGSDSSFAWYGGAIGSLGYLNQNLATTAGSRYDLSFDVYNPTNVTTQFDAIFNGTTVYSFTNTVMDWTHITLTGLLASSAQTTLTFGARNDPNYIELDNVSVVAANAVPEPATLAIMLGGLALIAGLRRQRRAPRA